MCLEVVEYLLLGKEFNLIEILNNYVFNILIFLVVEIG